MDQRIGERQRWAWLASGLSVAAAACTCGFGWIWVLGAGLITTVYYIYIDKKLGPAGLAAMLPRNLGRSGRILAIITMLWLVIAMAWVANLADAAFPMVDGFPGLGWVLLALHFWLKISIWWFVGGLVLWILVNLVGMWLMGWAARCSAGKDPPKENKNPYSKKST